MLPCRQGRPVALSLEMFERDVQGIMDEYLAGMIAERDLQRVRHYPCSSIPGL
jgi:uncharacterized iron-regulated protein